MGPASRSEGGLLGWIVALATTCAGALTAMMVGAMFFAGAANAPDPWAELVGWMGLASLAAALGGAAAALWLMFRGRTRLAAWVGLAPGPFAVALILLALFVEEGLAEPGAGWDTGALSATDAPRE